MKKIITLSVATLTALTLVGRAAVSADSVVQNTFDSKETVNFTAAPDTSHPGIVDPEIPGVAGVIALDYAYDLDFVAMHDLRGERTWSITVTQLAQFKNGTNDLTGA